MLLFVGLGNPGAKYAGNRHNIGFMALDRIAEDHGFGPWKAKFQGALSEGRLGGERVLLLKPMTFMNLSGQSVGEAMRFYKLMPEDVTVFHDELDLAPGKVRVKTGGGHAGHNGLRSLHQHIGETYRRVRLGIGHPGRKEMVAHYVLQDFAKADGDWLDDLMRGISDGAGDLADDRKDRFLNAIAQRMAPTGSAAPKTPRESTAPAAGEAGKAPGASPEDPSAGDPRSPLQKLVDRFR
ncbi:peptidyl-tRNA hydrolase [Roseovarius halotolerans]|uniref:Peptidyl-tRNA hydrolase n=1 Tax=Roseovarius halotolerans TaxID=505353 RepID=A0A1X6YW97_9RHOB|nr:aminoacyl-tRNA hydrolase [Roseovarius halotolerans]RKT32740.1 peptidyl-tRNA hydrolase [Roseovarius halotolerans]SLN33466.1 Peptidyl-tRNA hydrolase [Roseovarius halotolerans]